MNTTAPSRPRRALFSAIVALMLLAFLELGSVIVLFAFGGKLYTPWRGRAERETVLEQAQRRSNNAARQTVEQPSVERQPAGSAARVERPDDPPEVVHPFLGFVRDPTVEEVRFKLNSLGFFDSKPPRGPAADRLTIGVFGGSVAVGLARSRRLAEELKASPLLRGKTIWVRNFALGGYKQPQQLIALNYVLAVGESLDIVVNLDGFNDIALAPREHEASGLNPFYPRRWPRRVAQLPNVESQRLIGEIAFLEARRAARAGWCSRPPLSLSPTCHLAWKLVDSRAAGRLVFLRGALAEQTAVRRQYLTLGPQVDYATDDELLRDLSELWSRSSLQMHQVSAAQGIDYFHFLQPNQYFPGSKPLSLVETREAFNAEHPWGEIVPKGYARLAAAGRELEARGVSFYDLRMVFADVESTLYVDTCCHFNQQGMDLVAAAIARAILEQLESG